VKIQAAKGEEFVKKTLATDAGACQIGEFSLTDIRFSKIDKFMADTLFDENFGGRYGNCHVAVGVSYSDTFDGDPAKLTEARKKELGFNDSCIHWDIINTEDKLVTAKCKNGKTVTVYEKGKFKY
jgi:aminopeptidase